MDLEESNFYVKCDGETQIRSSTWGRGKLQDPDLHYWDKCGSEILHPAKTTAKKEFYPVLRVRDIYPGSDTQENGF